MQTAEQVEACVVTYAKAHLATTSACSKEADKEAQDHQPNHNAQSVLHVPSECDDVIRRGARQQKAEGYRISDLEQSLGC